MVRFSDARDYAKVTFQKPSFIQIPTGFFKVIACSAFESPLSMLFGCLDIQFFVAGKIVLYKVINKKIELKIKCCVSSKIQNYIKYTYICTWSTTICWFGGTMIWLQGFATKLITVVCRKKQD
jgi:hypothetical protein